EPALTALNESLRDAYIADCARALLRWNKTIADSGIDFRLTLPHRGFRRAIGEFNGVFVTPAGLPVSEAEWHAREAEWLPTRAEREFVGSLMTPVVDPGKFASWIAPPPRGINHLPIELDYVRHLPAG